jgi:glycosyltransferase involved in cell wall biosynthesis
MNLLLVSSSSSGSGGGELFFLKLAKRFVERGLVVTVAYSADSLFDELATRAAGLGCSVIRFVYTRVYDRRFRSLELLFGAKASAVAGIDLSDYDVIHVSQQNIEDGIDLVAAIGRVCPERLVVTVHIVERLSRLGQRLGWVRQLYSGLVFRKLQSQVRFAFVCASAMRLFSSITSANPVFGRVVYNGAECVAPTKTHVEVRALLGFADGDFVVGSVGRLEEQKNYSLLVRAFCMLYAVRPNARLIFVGDGNQRASLQSLVDSCGLQSRVTITGWVNDPENYLQVMDTFVLPSWFEGFPFALVEALIAGKVCLASSIPPHIECLAERSELLFDSSDDVRLAKTLRRLSDGDADLKRISLETIEIARERFSFESMVEGMIALYNIEPCAEQTVFASIK